MPWPLGSLQKAGRQTLHGGETILGERRTESLDGQVGVALDGLPVRQGTADGAGHGRRTREREHAASLQIHWGFLLFLKSFVTSRLVDQPLTRIPACCTEEEEAREFPIPHPLIMRRERSSDVQGRAFC